MPKDKELIWDIFQLILAVGGVIIFSLVLLVKFVMYVCGG